MNKPSHPHIDGVIEAARQNLKQGPELMPTFFIGNDEKTAIVGAHWTDDNEKDMTALAVRQMIKEMEADFVIFVVESWTIPKDKAQDFMDNREKYPEVRLYPEAYECVVFQLENSDGCRLGMAKVLPGRELGEIEWTETTTIQGRFSNLLGKRHLTPVQ